MTRQPSPFDIEVLRSLKLPLDDGAGSHRVAGGYTPGVFKLSDEDRPGFAHAVEAAAGSAAVVAGVRAIYDAFEAERATRGPRCDQSGKCCRFEAYGHRLFVSTAEVAAFRAELSERPVASVAGWDGTGCAYQVDGLCNAHAARPFGCRVYFCDPTATGWQQDQYERFHAALRELHGRLGVPYWYVEWRDALDAAGLPDASGPANGAAAGVGQRLRILTVPPPAGNLPARPAPTKLVGRSTRIDDVQREGRTMKKIALLSVSIFGVCAFAGCATPGYSAKERGQQISRNFDMEEKMAQDDIDDVLLLRPMTQLSRWTSAERVRDLGRMRSTPRQWRGVVLLTGCLPRRRGGAEKRLAGESRSTGLWDRRTRSMGPIWH